MQDNAKPRENKTLKKRIKVFRRFQEPNKEVVRMLYKYAISIPYSKSIKLVPFEPAFRVDITCKNVMGFEVWEMSDSHVSIYPFFNGMHEKRWGNAICSLYDVEDAEDFIMGHRLLTRRRAGRQKS